MLLRSISRKHISNAYSRSLNVFYRQISTGDKVQVFSETVQYKKPQNAIEETKNSNNEFLSNNNTLNVEKFTKEDFLKKSLELIEKKIGFLKQLPRTSDIPKLNQLKQWIQWLHNRSTVFISIDLEVFEINNNVPLEVGISVLDFKNQEFSLLPETLDLHFIIKEYKHVTNSQRVPNNKHRFINGTSHIIPKNAMPKILEKIINHYKKDSKKGNDPSVVFVGHYFSADVTFLQKSLKIKLPADIPIIDTKVIWNGIFEKNDFTYNGASLEYILRKLNIPGIYLHNGANDAYFTLQVVLKLLDPQNIVMKYCKDYEFIYDMKKFTKIKNLIKEEKKLSAISKKLKNKNETAETNEESEENCSLEEEKNETTEEPKESKLKIAGKKIKIDYYQEFMNQFILNKDSPIYNDELKELYSVRKQKKLKKIIRNNHFMGVLQLTEEEFNKKIETYWENH